MSDSQNKSFIKIILHKGIIIAMSVLRVHIQIRIYTTQSCWSTLQSKLLQNTSGNVAGKTNARELTAAGITLSFVSFVHKMHKLKHIQKPTTQPQIHV